MNPIAAEQVRLNRMTRDNWDRAATHRAQVTGLLLDGPMDNLARLCVLGAGNANDLDLDSLLARFREVHLVDLDREALAAGLARQRPGDAARVHLHGDIDLTGVTDALARLSPGIVAEDPDLDRLIQDAKLAPAPAMPGPFEVVASVCLLSQLIHAVVSTLGENHPRFLETALALRIRHLKLLVELLVPGGLGVLVTDVVSSSTAPELATVPEPQFQEALVRLVNAGNFFTGTNPVVLKSLFDSDPCLSPLVRDAQLLRPWRWQLGGRIFGVCAIRMKKR